MLNFIISHILRQAFSISSDICTRYYQKPFFCRPYWILAAILNCPRMPIWHHPDFKSGYPYQLISTKTFSIDAIARSSWVHAGLYSLTPFIHWSMSEYSDFCIFTICAFIQICIVLLCQKLLARIMLRYYSIGICVLFFYMSY